MTYEEALLIEDSGSSKHRSYVVRRAKILSEFPQAKSFVDLLKTLYESPMSSEEIVELFASRCNIAITSRSVQRNLVSAGVQLREKKEAFGLAIKKKRVVWAYQAHRKKRPQVPHGLRLKILERDNFRCVLCGQTAKDSLLEIDHIKAKVHGGSNDPLNLRVLCFECNQGKRLLHDESSSSVLMASGSSS